MFIFEQFLCINMQERKTKVMTKEDKNLLDRINEYADHVLKDFDPQKTRVSFQLEKLKPIMEEIAKEKNMTVEEIFIKYMDLASQVTVDREIKFQNTIGNMTKYGDVHLSLIHI